VLPQPVVGGVRAIGDAVWRASIDRVAVVGASKNAGKTTAMNALVSAASLRGWTCGLVSIGLDGEAMDAWLDVPKPPVAVERGTLVATALAMVDRGDRAFEVVGALGFATTLGPTVIARARRPGTVQLAGIAHRGQLRQAVNGLQRAGAQKLLIDGAYHRQAAAHPLIADGVVAAVGAILGPDPESAVAAAEPSLWALTRPRWQGQAGHGVCDVQGALSDRAIAAMERTVRWAIARDPSCVLPTPRGRRQLAARQIEVAVQEAVPLLAVAANPWRPDGDGADPQQLAAALALAVTRLGSPAAVVDVVHGVVLQRQQEAS
jgi:hypothetical protein